MSFGLGRIRTPCSHVELGVVYEDGVGCPRCHGTNEYYDFEWSSQSGDVQAVEDMELLSSLTRKAILTSQATAVFHPEYGTRLSEYVGIVANNVYIQAVAEMEVVRACAGVMTRQKQQLASGQTLSTSERLGRVEQVLALPSGDRSVELSVRIAAKDEQEATVSL